MSKTPPQPQEQITSSEHLMKMIRAARELYESWPAIDRAIHDLEQRKSNVRGARDFDNSPEKNALMDAAIAAMPEYVLLEAYRNLKRQFDEAQVRNAELEEATKNLCDKLDAVDESMKGIYTVAILHGVCYQGPTYGKEREAARAVLKIKP